MQNINIFLVTSPSQLLGAIEAKEHYNHFDSLLVIKYGANVKNNKLMKKMLSFSKWDNIIIVNYRGTIGDFIFMYHIARLKKTVKKIENIFVGMPLFRPFQWFCENLNAHRCFVLDDGSYTISLQKNHFSKNDYLQKTDVLSHDLKINIIKKYKNILKVFAIRYIFGLRGNKIIKYDLFTCFDVKTNPEQVLYRHNFEFIKSMGSACYRLKNEVYFYGSPISEYDIVSLNTEMEMLNKIKNYYSKKEKKIIYIPHRYDSDEKIVLIENLDISIKRLDHIAEVEPIFSKILPSDIASIVSTTLFTLSKIYTYDSITAFKIPKSLIIQEWRKDYIDNYYNEVKQLAHVVEF